MMKPLGLILFCALLSCSFIAQSQLPNNQCFLGQKKGLMNASTIIVLPIKNNNYIIEYYESASVLNGIPKTDTLSYKDYRFFNNDYAVYVEDNRLVIQRKEERQEYKFQLRTLCDPTINEIRNKPYNNALLDKITNVAQAKQFKKDTENAMASMCHEEFVKFADKLFEALK